MFNCGMNVFPIFITLLFCGFLFVYFNTRLAQLKNAVEKQNRVLTSFITNIQSDIRGGGGNGCGSGSSSDNASCDYDDDEREIKNIVISENHLASDEAVNAVRRLEREKIVVSDDSESEDSDSDNDSDSEDSDDEKEEEVLDDIKVIKLQDNIEEVVVAEPLVELINIESNFSVDALLDAAASTSTADTDATPSYEQMKVDDLRKVVADKGLASKEEIKKLKKPELLVLLKK